MRIYRRLPTIESGIATKRRKLWLIAASTLASTFLGVSEPALAQVCTPVANGGTLTAGAPSTTATGTFDTNINFGGITTPPPPPFPPVTLTLTLAPGVIDNSPGGNAVNVANTGGPSTSPGVAVTITADGATITNTTNTGGMVQSGLRIQSSGDAVINATNTTIDVNGTGGGNNAIWAISYGQVSPVQGASVTWTGPSITSMGANSTGIQADNRGVGNASIDASGNISGKVGTASGFTFLGLDAVAGDTTGSGLGGPGNASAIYRSGTINVQGAGAAGIFAAAETGSATIQTLPGTTIMVSQEFSTDTLQPGVDAFSTNGNTTDTVASTIQIDGSPTVPTTNYKSNPTGIRASSDESGDASVVYTGPRITVRGGGGLGIVALSGSPDNTTKSGNVTVNASGSGPIVADGSNADGILADSGLYAMYLVRGDVRPPR
jgi:fibronectin-binding autotransporter adhesin